MPAEDDILLLQLIKQDDEKAFKHLFDTYFVSLCRFMSLYLRDKQEIEYGYALAADTSVEMEELNRLIEEAVCSLPDKCGQVYRKSREEGKTNQEIAGEMGISVKTVEAQITKALKHIKKFLGEQYTYLF